MKEDGKPRVGFPILCMSMIRDGRLPITLDRERHILFSLNVIDQIQDRFGSFDDLTTYLSGTGAIKNLRWLLTLLLNEGAETGEDILTEAQVGKMIHLGNFKAVQKAIFEAFAIGNPAPEEGEGTDEEDSGEEEAGGSQDDDEKNP